MSDWKKREFKGLQLNAESERMKKSYASAVKSRNYPQDRPWYLTQPTQSNVRVTGDDTADNVEKSKATTAIFIHAGAGFHSTANEAAHLGACSE